MNQLIAGKTWNKPTELKQGILILLKEDNTHPLQWPMGQLTSLHPGTDGITRVVIVRTEDQHRNDKQNEIDIHSQQ